MSEVSNHNWQDNPEQPAAPPSWEALLHTRASELYAQRSAPMRAEIERLQTAFNEISARLVEQTTAAVSEQETAGLLDHVKQWFSDSSSRAEEDFQTRLAQARQEAEQEFESRLAHLRSEWEAQRPSEDEVQQRLEQASTEAAAIARREAASQIEELREQVEASRKALTMTVASSQAAAAQAGNFDLLKAAIEELDAQRTQSDTLTSLVRSAAQFAPRVAFFVVKGGEAVGWKATGFENGLNDETVKLLNVPTQQPTLLREALTSAQAAVGRSDTPGENSAVLGLYGSPAPERALAIPLVVRGKAAAVLYADSGTQSEKAINTAALETLLRAASMGIELLPARRGLEPPRPAAPPPVSQAAAAAPTPAPMSEQPTPTFSPALVAESRAEFAPAYERKMVDAPPTNPFARTAPEPAPEPAAEVEPEPVAATPERTTGELPKADEAESTATMAAPAPAVTLVESEPVAAEAEAPAPEVEDWRESSAPTLLDTPMPVVVEPDSRPDQFDSFAAPPPPPAPPVYVEEQRPAVDDWTPPASPPPTLREEAPVPPVSRFTSPAPEPLRPPQPISVPTPTSETEQRAHNDARRFARLLVSEIKLYNAAKVNEGRRNLDLYERLRDEVDRSRKVYDKRVSPAVATRFDYFYDELVQTLAEGDAAKLGANCPGPVVLSS